MKQLAGVFIEGLEEKWFVFSKWQYSIFGIPVWVKKEYITEYDSSPAESDYCVELLRSFTKKEAIEEAKRIKTEFKCLAKKQVLEVE